MTVAGTVYPVGHKSTPTEIETLLVSLRARSNTAALAANGTLTLSSSSATYVNITGATAALTKQLGSASSDVVVVFAGSLYLTGATGTVSWGISDGTTTTDLTKHTVNVAAHHEPFVGAVKLTGLAAGSYTFQLKVKTTGGTMNVDASDYVTMWVIERPK